MLYSPRDSMDDILPGQDPHRPCLPIHNGQAVYPRVVHPDDRVDQSLV